MTDRLILTASLLLTLIVSSTAVQARDPFPRPVEIETDVHFWTRVFTEIDTHSGFIHDDRDLGVVYDTLEIPSRVGPKSREQRISAAKRRYKKILLQLASADRDNLNNEHQRVLALWPQDVSDQELRKAAGRLRFQGGQSDRFRAGIIRSGRWVDRIRTVFADMGLPEQLVALPLIESAYHPGAYSRARAAGLWQIIPSTGRRYLRVDSVVDERMEPIEATKAAAKLLKHNYEVTGTWPLAITAYNHGAAGMQRAVRELRTRSIATIMREYKGRSFRFASRNFYPEFLAAVDVYHNAAQYYGPLERETSQDVNIVTVPAYMTVGSIQRALGIDVQTLRAANPALRASVWNGSRRVPRDYRLRVPRDATTGDLAQALASVPASARHATQQAAASHKVRRGETLSQIATRFKTSVRRIVQLNELRSANRIRVGQLLRLPGPTAPRHAAVSTKRSPRASEEVYTVRTGDTLSSIARHFGIRERDLASTNNLRDRHLIYVGQTLRIRTSSERSGAT